MHTRRETVIAALLALGVAGTATACTGVGGVAIPSSPVPSSVTSPPPAGSQPVATGPTGSSAASRSGPQSRVVLKVSATGATPPSQQALDILVSALTQEVSAFPGATVTATPPDTITVTAPTKDLDGLRDALVIPSMTIRPVTATWSPSATGGGSPPAGTDPASPNQPTAAATTAWLARVSRFAAGGGGPSCREITAHAGNDDPERPLLACDGQGAAYLLQPAVLSGDDVSSATAADDPQAGWQITVTLNASGTATWAAWTTANVGKQVAVVVNGIVISAPTVQQPITTPATQISGSFDKSQATDLANAITFASLPLTVAVTEATVLE